MSKINFPQANPKLWRHSKKKISKRDNILTNSVIILIATKKNTNCYAYNNNRDINETISNQFIFEYN